MSLRNTIRPRPRTPHICAACARSLVQAADVVPEGRSWRVVLHCPSCGFDTEDLLDEETLDRFDEELDRGYEELALALRHLTHLNMVEYAERFAAALVANVILPEDF
jgi:hypothetical protein